MKRSALGSLHLGIVVTQVLLQVRQLDERTTTFWQVALVRALTSVQAGVLLDVRQLLELAITVGTFVGLLAGVDPDVLHQLVVGGEALETLLTLVRFVLGRRGQLGQQVLDRQDITGAVELRRCSRNGAQVPNVLNLHSDFVLFVLSLSHCSPSLPCFGQTKKRMCMTRDCTAHGSARRIRVKTTVH